MLLIYHDKTYKYGNVHQKNKINAKKKSNGKTLTICFLTKLLKASITGLGYIPSTNPCESQPSTNPCESQPRNPCESQPRKGESLVRANLARGTSPPNSTPRRFPYYLLLTFLLYFLLIFYLPHCTLPDFPSVSSQVSLPFLSCYRTATTSISSLASLTFLSCCYRTTT